MKRSKVDPFLTEPVSPWPNGLAPSAASNGKEPQTGHLKQQMLIFSQFSRLEVHDQGVSSFGFSWGLSPWL